MKFRYAILVALPLLLAACDPAILTGGDQPSKKSQVVPGITRAQCIDKFGPPSLQKQYPLSAVRDSDRLMIVMEAYPPEKRGQSATICECQWKDGDGTLTVLFHLQNGDWPLLGVVEPTGGDDNLPRMYQ